MPKVDFSNPFLRDFVPKFLVEHEQRLDKVSDSISGWVKAAGSQNMPLAAVLDIDELILCNIHPNGYKAEGIDFQVADLFQWPRKEILNPLYPGARRLLETLRSAGVEIFFVSGRLESIRDETIANFVKVGLAEDKSKSEVKQVGAEKSLPLFDTKSLAPGGIVYHCPDDWKNESIRPFKERCRAEISKKHHIILNAGDQASDLGNYGDHQILFPHPFYFTA